MLLATLEVSAPETDSGADWAARLLRDLGATRTPCTGASLRFGGVSAAIGAADPVEDWARSGVVALTGRADGPPLLPPGNAASAARGATLAIESLSVLAGERVRIDGPSLLGERAALLGLRRRGAISAGGGSRILPARDGWVALTLARSYDVGAVPALVENPVSGDPWTAVARWSRSKPAAEAAARAELLSLAAAVLPEAPPPATWAVGEVAGRTRARRQVPLVVDLTSLWAGPLCAHVLGLAGCRVVKVESRTRPDGARFGFRGFFDLLHAGHELVVLDLETRAGVDALRALVSAADVVLDSSRPRALEQLDVRAEEIVRVSGCAWITISAHGRDANRVGFGDDVACAAGLFARHGDRAPVFCGDAIADPLAGLHAAVVALAAIVSGRGGLFDVSMCDVVAATLPPGPSGCAHAAVRTHRGWTLESTDGAVVVERPRARMPCERPAEVGGATRAIVAEFDLSRRLVLSSSGLPSRLAGRLR